MIYNILINDIIPIFVIMALGYLGAKIHSFSPTQTQVLNKVVLDIALPAALIASITRANRELIFSDLSLTLVALIGITGLFLLCFFISLKFWKRNIQDSAVCALIAGSPTVGFLGFAVLDPIYGVSTQTGLVVAISAIVVNAVTLPIGFYLLNLGNKTTNSQASNLSAIIQAFKQPVVWSPLCAVLIVLCGIRLPEAFYPPLDLIAKANSGIAVFAAGLAMATVPFSISLEICWNSFFRLILSPLLICVLGVLFQMKMEILSMLVMACALPPAFSGTIISSRYNIYVKTGGSSLAVSTLLFALTAPFWLWATPIIAHYLQGLIG